MKKALLMRTFLTVKISTDCMQLNPFMQGIGAIVCSSPAHKSRVSDHPCFLEVRKSHSIGLGRQKQTGFQFSVSDRTLQQLGIPLSLIVEARHIDDPPIGLSRLFKRSLQNWMEGSIKSEYTVFPSHTSVHVID